ncbi:MAG: DUF2625 family protein [Candidatus Melainabacteria bacterium]|mgnify:CR=1 FL=1|nr:DUF2625 family protein [Candidatus Melainabacteria bacterium]
MTQELDQLIDLDDPAWPLVQEWLASASNAVVVLPPSEPGRSATLLDLQISTQSTLGSIAYETGGLLVDNGWLRILGSGHQRLTRSVTEWNKAVWGDEDEDYPFYLIADDVIGGFYALDSGILGNAESVFYYSPDTLEWEDTDQGYTDFIDFCFNGDLQKYYGSMRWKTWKEDVVLLTGDQAVSVVPPLAFTLEPDLDPIDARERTVVSVYELYDFHVLHLPNQLHGNEDEEDLNPPTA